jgi:hypothetical protein
VGTALSLNHLYGYADQTPLLKVDPQGLDPFGQSGSRKPQLFPSPFDVFIPGSEANKAFGRSIGQIGRAIREACSPEDDRERCAGVLKNCRKLCNERFVDGDLGRGSDAPQLLRKCIRECMETNGCYDF